MQQYLAIGEAPDATQQAFQQRSRWSKGHFQVFWSRECPLFDGRLNLFYRLAYSSTCVSYLSTGLSVIVLNLVPVLTILFGWFPIALNFYTVVGITAYFAALNALSYYCLSWSHYKVCHTTSAKSASALSIPGARALSCRLLCACVHQSLPVQPRTTVTEFCTTDPCLRCSNLLLHRTALR